MTDKLVLKSSHEVIYTVDVADVESIFYCKPTDPDILTVLMKDGKRLYCDEVCPIDSLQENPVCAFSTNRYTDEDRKVLCDGCEEDCKYAQEKEPISKVWHDANEEPVAGQAILLYGKDMCIPAKSFCAEYDRDIVTIQPTDKWAYIDDLLMFTHSVTKTSDQEEPVSEDLEEASKEWLKPQLDKSYATYGETKQMELTRFDGYAMLDAIEFGAEWQKTKDQSTIELAEDHAMLAGMEKMKEEMMKGAVEGYVTLTMTGVPTVAATVPEGKYNFDDKVKLVIIKED